MHPSDRVVTVPPLSVGVRHTPDHVCVIRSPVPSAQDTHSEWKPETKCPPPLDWALLFPLGHRLWPEVMAGEGGCL